MSAYFAVTFIALMTMSTSFAGVLVGNGGDSIFCQKTGETGKFSHSGFYVLDYAITFPDFTSNLARVSSLQASLDRIENLVRSRAPEALQSFLSFRKAWTPVPFVDTHERAWIPSDRPLMNIRDEWARKLPVNCRFSKTTRKFYGILQQTVVRRRLSSGRVVYQYDPDIVGDYLTRLDPTQASVLFVHEWLWDFYEGDPLGAPRIRSANLFLHSLDAEWVSSDEFVSQVFHAKVSL